MKYLLTGVAAIAMLTGCGPNDKPGDAPAKVEARKGDPATAQAALTALELDASDRLTFASNSLDGDTAVFENVTLIAPDGAEDFDEADIKADRLEIEGLAMVDGKPNFARMVMSGLSIVPEDEADAGGSASIGSIELVNPSPAMAAWVADVLTEEDPGDLPEGDVMSFDRWALNAINFQIDDEGETGSFLVDAIEINSLKDQKVGQMLLKNFAFDMVDEVEGTDVTANVDLFDVRGMDFSTIADAAENADALGESFMGFATPSDPANPGYDTISVQNLDVDVSGATFTLPSMNSSVERDDMGRAVKVVTEPFTMSLAGGEGEFGEMLSTQLATMGYETVELTMAGESSYDPETDTIELDKGKNYWELKDGFRIDFSGKYDGVSKLVEAQQDIGAEIADNPTAAMAMFEDVNFHNFEISLDDNGIVDRGFNAYAAQTGEDPQQLRNQVAGLLAMAPMMAGGSGIDMELINEASSALSSFVTDPKTLTISFAPAEPLGMETLMALEDPSAINKEMLGFSASNE